MADLVLMEKDGYGQVETNNVAFRRDGRIEAQCKLDATQFPAGATAIGSVLENGMLVSIDNKSRTLKKATATLAASTVIGMAYSSEHMYDERKPGLKNFFLSSDDVLPRIGLLAVGDKFHTNTVCYSDDLAADNNILKALIKSSTAYYAGINDTTGYWEVVAVANKPAAGPVARVVDYATMPDGQPGLKLQVISV